MAFNMATLGALLGAPAAMGMPRRLGDLRGLGADPSVSPSLASLLASAGAVAPNGMEAPRAGNGLSPAPQVAAAPAPGVDPAASARMDGKAGTLGGLMPVSLGSAAPAPSMAAPANLGELVNGLPQGDLKARHPLFGKGGLGWTILGVIGDSISAANGREGTFIPALMHQREQEREQNYAMERLNAEVEAKRKAALAPHLEQVGNSIGMVDGNAGTFNPIYTAPGAADQYALALNLKPGTPEYADAAREYVLRGYSDYATGNKLDVIDHRYDRSDAQLGRRLATTQRGQDLAHTDRQQSILHRGAGRSGGPKAPTPATVVGGIMDKQARGQPLTPSEQLTLQQYRQHPKPSRESGGQAVRVGSPAEAQKLPAGTLYETPDGRIMRR